MASLQPLSIKGRKYWRIVESVRVDGKPRPIPICYLGTVDRILEVFTDLKNKKEDTTSKNGHTENSSEKISKEADKTIQRLSESRDNWKNKCQKAKENLKIKILAVKRLQDGREKLKEKIQENYSTIRSLQEKLNNSENAVDRLQSQLKAKNKEITDLKKK